MRKISWTAIIKNENVKAKTKQDLQNFVLTAKVGGRIRCSMRTIYDQVQERDNNLEIWRKLPPILLLFAITLDDDNSMFKDFNKCFLGTKIIGDAKFT